jgi:hypothetical protein
MEISVSFTHTRAMVKHPKALNLIFYSQPNVKLQGKIDKQKIGAFGTTFIAKNCDSSWSSFVFLLSKVHIHHKNSFSGSSAGAENICI